MVVTMVMVMVMVMVMAMVTTMVRAKVSVTVRAPNSNSRGITSPKKSSTVVKRPGHALGFGNGLGVRE